MMVMKVMMVVMVVMGVVMVVMGVVMVVMMVVIVMMVVLVEEVEVVVTRYLLGHGLLCVAHLCEPDCDSLADAASGCSGAPSWLCMGGYVVAVLWLCYGCRVSQQRLCYGCHVSQESIKVSVVPTALRASFQPLSSNLDCPGLSNQCGQCEEQDSITNRISNTTLQESVLVILS